MGENTLVRYLLLILLLVSNAFAVTESICPTGSSPRGDIVSCIEFDTLGACTTGQEGACATANGLTSLSVVDSDGLKIKTCPVTPPVGTGCIYGSGKPGSTGTGYGSKTISPQQTSGGVRFYVQFGNGYLQAPTTYNGNHFPSYTFTDGATCTGIIGLDINAGGLAIQIEENNPAGCGANAPSSYNVPINIDSTWVPQSNRWYAIETRVIMNTTATTSVGTTGGNGTLQILVDDVVRASYTTMNFDGSVVAKLDSFYTGRSYYGPGVPAWKPNVYFDQFVFSNNATAIGVASPVAALGTADTTSPYVNYEAYQGFEGSKMNSDCSTPGSFTAYPQTGLDSQWGTGNTTFVTTPVVNTYVNSCTGNLRSMKASTVASNTGAGIYSDLLGARNRFVVHGRVYLDAANDYASDTPLFGFSRYGTGSSTDYGLMIGRNAAGNWMLWQKNNPTLTKTDLAVSASTNAWHHFEFHAASTGKVSLYIDGTQILDESTPAVAFWSWLSDTVSAGSRKWNIGVFTASPATTFNVYYDDVDVGTASFVDSRGWDAASSPFATPTPTPAPSTLILPKVYPR